MQLKPKTAIIVLSLVVASLLVAGCTTSTTSNTNQTPSASATPSTATRDAFLEKYLAAYNKGGNANQNISIKADELTWINGTSARLETSFLNKTTNHTENGVSTFMVFPTSQDATNYLNSMNKTAYSLASTQYGSSGAYVDATGHTPQIYKEYQWNEGNPSNISEYKYHAIMQFDNLVIIHTGKRLS